MVRPLSENLVEDHSDEETGSVLFVSGVGTLAIAQHSAPPPAPKPAIMMTGWQPSSPCVYKNVQAQQFFDQGLRLIYAFNHDEAVRPSGGCRSRSELAIAHWGVAKPWPELQRSASDERFKAAHEAIQKAVLSAGAPANEQAYIAAMAEAVSGNAKADRVRCRRLPTPCVNWRRVFRMTWMPRPVRRSRQ